MYNGLARRAQLVKIQRVPEASALKLELNRAAHIKELARAAASSIESLHNLPTSQPNSPRKTTSASKNRTSIY